jgi:hypothetical protein
MTKHKTAGVVGLALVLAAMVMGAGVIFSASLLAGGIYVLIFIVGWGVVIYAFCAKCPCKRNCGHILPGLAARLFKRRPAAYSKMELAAVVVSLLGMVAFPQYWLWQYPVLLVVFWVLAAIAGVLSPSIVCKGCNNTFCPLFPQNQVR